MMSRLFLILTLMSAMAGATRADAGLSVTGPEIKACVSAYVYARTQADSAQVTLEFVNVPDQIDLGEESDDLRVLPRTSDLFRGTTLLYVGAYKGSHLVRRIPVTVRARVLKPTLIASQMIDRHSVLEPSDVHTEMIDITTLGGTPLDSVEQLSGVRARRVINPGQAVLESMIERPPVIGRGDQVTIRVSIGSVTASTFGVARQEGRVGERIPVVNLSSGKELQARVESSNLVVIDALERNEP